MVRISAGGQFYLAAYWEQLFAREQTDAQRTDRLLQDLMAGGESAGALPQMGEHTVLQYALRCAAGPLVVGTLLRQWRCLAHVPGADAQLALHTACTEGARHECVRLVLAANPLAAGVRCASSREAALHCALRARAEDETVELLLEHCPCALMMVGREGTPLEVAIRSGCSPQVVAQLCLREPVSCGVLACDRAGLMPLEQALRARCAPPCIAALLAATLEVAPRVFRAMNEGMHSPDALRLGIFMEPRREPRAPGDDRNVCFHETMFRGATHKDVISADEMRRMVEGWQDFVCPEGVRATRAAEIVSAALQHDADPATLALLLEAFPLMLAACVCGGEAPPLLKLLSSGEARAATADMHALTCVAQAAAREAGSCGGRDLLLLYGSLSGRALQELRERSSRAREYPCPRIAACEAHSWALFDLRQAWGPASTGSCPHAKQAAAAIVAMEQRLKISISHMFRQASRGIRRRLRLQKKGEPPLRADAHSLQREIVCQNKRVEDLDHQMSRLCHEQELERARMHVVHVETEVALQNALALTECCICFEAKNTVLQPCRHLCVCESCRGTAPLPWLCPAPLPFCDRMARRLTPCCARATGDLVCCPICRTSIDSVMRIFN